MEKLFFESVFVAAALVSFGTSVFFGATAKKSGARRLSWEFALIFFAFGCACAGAAYVI